jgi:hypothetical protein
MPIFPSDHFGLLATFRVSTTEVAAATTFARIKAVAVGPFQAIISAVEK